MISKHILLITFLNEPELIFFALLNDFTYFYLIRILPLSINHLLAHFFNAFKNCYLTVTIELNISHLFTNSEMIKQFYFKRFSLALVNNQVLLFISNTSIK